MNEKIQLSNGKVIPFYSSLSYSGIYVDVKKTEFKDADEKKLFERELKNERDVVKIIYQ